MWVKACGVVLLAGAFSACTTAFEDMGGIYVSPGKFDLLKCPDIAQRSIAASKREKELTSLMDRSNQDPAGPVVNALVYSTDLSTVRAELAMLHKTAAEKNCDNLVTEIKEPPPDEKPASPRNKRAVQSPQ
jgi:hypothetical protein